jgi:FlaA1/EpsC-like NDP-sugar epimerase
MDQIFREYKPDLVFDAAAYKHVPLMEENPQEAFKTNILGTDNMARLASEHRAECFVMVATDGAIICTKRNFINLKGCLPFPTRS